MPQPDLGTLPSKLVARMAARLERQQKKARRRQLQLPCGIDFSSNDYLGLANHAAIRQALQQALADGVPLGSGGSRLLRGNHHWHTDFERELAVWKGSESALLFSSGYAANVGLIGSLCQPSDLIFTDALIHASMIDGIKESKAKWLSFNHNDPLHLRQLLDTHSQHQGVRWILVESLYSMDGDRAPLAELAEIAQSHQATLVVDEAHATGVFGTQGRGLLDVAGLDASQVIAVHTCGKAWGASGAFVTCPQLVRDFLINQCRGFIYSTAPSPLQIVQWRAAKNLIANEPERAQHVLDLAAQFRQAFARDLDMGKSDSQIVPIIIGDDQRCLEIAASLQAQGFDIRAIRPPSVPRGTARLRVSFSAKHTPDQLERLITCLQKIIS